MVPPRRAAHTAALRRHAPPRPTPSAQLEALAKELRRKQKDLKENASGNVFQRARFADLRRLLRAKADLYRTGAPAAGEGKVGDEEFVTGGANVMRMG